MAASFSKETGGSANSFLQIINALAQVPFEGVLIDAYKGTRRNSDRLVIQLASMNSRVPLNLLVHGTHLGSLKLLHWLYLGQIFFKISSILKQNRKEPIMKH